MNGKSGVFELLDRIEKKLHRDAIHADNDLIKVCHGIACKGNIFHLCVSSPLCL